MRNIHETAIVSVLSKIHPSVTIGAYSVINEYVEIGENSVIGSFCEIGVNNKLNKSDQLVIGPGSMIRSHSVIYSGSVYGSSLETGHHVTLRENIEAGLNFRVGSYSDLQGDLIIGNYTRLHSNVHISKYTNIGDFVFIFPFCVVTNDPIPPSELIMGCTINNYAVIASSVTLLPGVVIGEHALVGAKSTVINDVESYSLVIGTPAVKIKDVRDLMIPGEATAPAYPWKLRFQKGFPEAANKILLQE
jgi:acetyltransferase-like isoleucine patch superfamily enzyme